jgi:hypothetical protein
MHVPAACYQMSETIDATFGDCLRPAQRRALVFWVLGTIRAKSACQSMVLAALLPVCDRSLSALRQYLREWLYDGKQKAAPCASQVDVTRCFVPLLRWVLSLWQGEHLALAIDVTNHGDTLHALCLSVLYRGCAIPVAWCHLAGNEKGAWLPHLCRLLDTVAEAIPGRMEVLVLMDGGLRSPALWTACREHGWHPMQRHPEDLNFRPAGYRDFHAAQSLVSGPGQAWVGAGTAFKSAGRQRPATLLVVWEQEQAAPWVLLTDLAPAEAGVAWYGLRFWVECGFRALKGMGWQWQKTRRTDPDRAARHWLVLAVATCWVLATGTRVEDAMGLDRQPAHLQVPPLPPRPRVRPGGQDRALSVFLLGLSALQDHLRQGRLWQRLWLTPEPWPQPPPGLVITRYAPPQAAA